MIFLQLMGGFLFLGIVLNLLLALADLSWSWGDGDLSKNKP